MKENEPVIIDEIAAATDMVDELLAVCRFNPDHFRERVQLIRAELDLLLENNEIDGTRHSRLQNFLDAVRNAADSTD